VLINNAQIERTFVSMDQKSAAAEIERLIKVGLDKVVILSVNPIVRQEGNKRYSGGVEVDP
jgi:hypothetical protein